MASTQPDPERAARLAEAREYVIETFRLSVWAREMLRLYGVDA